ncbi:MAG: ribonuclease III, partial [Eubacterium sp.]|nr:ribonuclease III [Eubacterium sp.]
RIECAPRQSAMIKAIKEDLTDQELKIYKRGRNAKSVTKAKNATTAEYRRATGLEAVIGYLYLTGDLQRAAELIKLGIERTL